MGRYKRRGSKFRQNRKKSENSGDGDDGNNYYSPAVMMGESDWIVLEKYLLEYRTRAYQAYRVNQLSGIGNHDINQLDDAPVIIGKHNFLPLTSENCRQPYLDLPDTLNSKERRKIHSMCAYLDLYHDTAGVESVQISGAVSDSTESNCAKNVSPPTPARRISVSIYEDGLRLVPNRDVDADGGVSQSFFPSQTCRPWYYRAYGNSTNTNINTINHEDIQQRVDAIEKEKVQIRQFANLPELTLRLPDDENPAASCDDLDFNILDQLDLSKEPTPDETPWMLVDTVDKLKLCVTELLYGVGNDGGSPKIHELAFDLEMSNVGKMGSSGVRTCLIQLTSDVATIMVDELSGSSKKVYKDYIIDPLAPGLWDAIPTYLGPIFSDPSIVKIGHGIVGMDTTSLHRDFGILIVNAFDTYEASAILTQRKHGMGLVALCHHYGLPSWEYYKELKNKFQCSDWKIRPLEKRAMEYGRFDIRYLVTLRKLLVRDLVKMDLLHSSAYLRVESSDEEDIGVDLVSEQETQSDSFEMRIDSSASSFNEDGDMPAANHSLKQFESVDGAGKLLPATGNSPPSKTIILASELPCYHYLMKAISISQKRCLKLWSGDEEEPILQNQSFISMMKQAASGTGHGKYWSDDHMQLYRQLAEWRVTVAQREFSSAPELCTLDFLVFVAYKTPKSRSEMRRYSYVLPKCLEDETLPYFYELREMVMSSDAFHLRQSHSLPETMNDVAYYSDRSILHEHDVRQNRLVKLLLTSAVVGVIAVALRARKR
ncbi:hypothetical protein ACHAWU_005592 [Discostella pseudostelligera]|uniref:3'-5' exonuclease domain-containing protein n=1 Tax=Discostella pseudostelligera TaxID=259834 RepID=A0ABD3N8J7_9STRA